MKIRFLETYQVKDQAGRTFHEGEVHDLPEPSARHFLRKNRAEVFAGEVPPLIQEPAPSPDLSPAAKIQPPPPPSRGPKSLSQGRAPGRKAGKGDLK